jgi:hypothetical protein
MSAEDLQQRLDRLSTRPKRMPKPSTLKASAVPVPKHWSVKGWKKEVAELIASGELSTAEARIKQAEEEDDTLRGYMGLELKHVIGESASLLGLSNPSWNENVRQLLETNLASAFSQIMDAKMAILEERQGGWD